MNELPVVLAERGFKVMTICPRYENYPDVYDIGLRVHINLDSEYGQQLIKKVLMDFYEKQARTTNTQRTLQSFRNLMDHLRHAKLYTKFDRGVQRVFVDHPIYMPSLLPGLDLHNRIYTYFDTVTNFQQLMLDILGQASLTAPLAFWDQDIYYGRDKGAYANQQFKSLYQQNGHDSSYLNASKNGKPENFKLSQGGDQKNKIVYIANDWHQAPFGARLSQLRDRFKKEQLEINKLSQLLRSDQQNLYGQGEKVAVDGITKYLFDEDSSIYPTDNYVKQSDQSEFGRRLNRHWIQQRLNKSINRAKIFKQSSSQSQNQTQEQIQDTSAQHQQARTIEQTLQNRYLSPSYKASLLQKLQSNTQNEDKLSGFKNEQMIYKDDWDMNQQQRAISTGINQAELDQVLTQYLGQAKLVNYIHNFSYQGTFTDQEYKGLNLPPEYLSNFQIASTPGSPKSFKQQDQKTKDPVPFKPSVRKTQIERDLQRLLKNTSFKNKLNKSVGNYNQIQNNTQELLNSNSKLYNNRFLDSLNQSTYKSTNPISWQKGILNMSDAIVTVSQSYSDQIEAKVNKWLRPNFSQQQSQQLQSINKQPWYQKVLKNNESTFWYPYLINKYKKQKNVNNQESSAESSGAMSDQDLQEIERFSKEIQENFAKSVVNQPVMDPRSNEIQQQGAQKDIDKARTIIKQETEALISKAQQNQNKFSDFIVPNERIDEKGIKDVPENPPFYEATQTREQMINGEKTVITSRPRDSVLSQPPQKLTNVSEQRADNFQSKFDTITEFGQIAQRRKEEANARQSEIDTGLGIISDLQRQVEDKLWQFSRRNAKDNLLRSGVNFKKFFGGFTNGIDMKSWDPERDPNMMSDLRYDAASADIIKPLCKRTLQQTLGLPENEGIPLFSFIGRLDHIKGIEILLQAIQKTYNQHQVHRQFEKHQKLKLTGIVDFIQARDYGRQNKLERKWYQQMNIINDLQNNTTSLSQVVFDVLSGKAARKLGLNWPVGDSNEEIEQIEREILLDKIPGNDLNVQFVVMGQGNSKYEQQLANLRNYFPNMCTGVVGMNEGLARKILAGSDYVIIPSLYEPCGLIAMQAQRYGAIPILTNVGGLKDICDPRVGLFYEGPQSLAPNLKDKWLQKQSNLLFDQILYATSIFGTENYKQRRQRAMRTDYSWDRTASEWEALIKKLVEEDG